MGPERTGVESISIESQPDDGLFGIVNRAQAAVSGEGKQEPVGVLAIDLDADKLEGADVQIEAAYAHKGARRVLQRLDVHARALVKEVAPDKLLSDAISGFGGQKFTNIVLAPPDTLETRSSRADAGRIAVPESGLSEALDLTVYFPSRVRFYAKNLALLSDGLEANVLEDLAAVLGALGVRSRRREATLLIAAQQLRAPVTREQQIAAYQEASRRGLPVSLYAATLPTTQSMRVTEERVELDNGESVAYVDCQLSHGLTPESMCTLTDATKMQEILKRHFALELGGRRWKVENVHGEPGDSQPQATGHGIKWSKIKRRR
jgi:hypothetical protein